MYLLKISDRIILDMFMIVGGLIFCFLCLWASRGEHQEGNTGFGDFVWLITGIFGYVGYFLGGSFMWFVFEDDLYPFFPAGLLIILISGGWAAGWFTDNDYKKMRRKETLEKIKNDGDNPTLLKIWGLVIIGFTIFLLFF
tara:strand:- start:84 stop:503 length:420 start_codon:yes stop_codon:yes gene_type:complete